MYSPASHGVQLLLAPAGDTLPGSHAVGTVAPAAHAEPAGHSLQSSTEVAFAAAFHDPAGQSNAAAAPAPQYEPAGQLRQVVAPAEGWKLPASQDTHSALPSAAVNEPGQQSRHRPPAAKVPAPHLTVSSNVTLC